MELNNLDDDKRVEDKDNDSGGSPICIHTAAVCNESSTISAANSKDEETQETDVAEEPSPKRLKLEESDADNAQPSPSTDEKGKEVVVVETLQDVKARLKAKEELLYQLKKVEAYKNKWTIEELKDLTSAWKGIGITTFEDLFQKSSKEKPSLTKEELLSHLGVDPDILGIDVDVTE